MKTTVLKEINRVMARLKDAHVERAFLSTALDKVKQEQRALTQELKELERKEREQRPA